MKFQWKKKVTFTIFLACAWSILRIWYVLSHFFPWTTPWSKNYYYPYFTGKESEAKFPCVLISERWRKGILSVYLEMCCPQKSVLLIPKSKYFICMKVSSQQARWLLCSLLSPQGLAGSLAQKKNLINVCQMLIFILTCISSQCKKSNWK